MPLDCVPSSDPILYPLAFHTRSVVGQVTTAVPTAHRDMWRVAHGADRVLLLEFPGSKGVDDGPMSLCVWRTANKGPCIRAKAGTTEKVMTSDRRIVRAAERMGISLFVVLYIIYVRIRNVRNENRESTHPT